MLSLVLAASLIATSPPSYPHGTGLVVPDLRPVPVAPAYDSRLVYPVTAIQVYPVYPVYTYPAYPVYPVYPVYATAYPVYPYPGWTLNYWSAR